MPGLDPGIHAVTARRVKAQTEWIAGSSPGMTRRELRRVKTQAEADEDLLLAARLLELWRLCGKTACRRARDCRGDPRSCCETVADWAESFSTKDKRMSFEEAMERLRAQE